MKIQAAISASAEAPFEIAEVELDDPRRDEVLVELRAVGVCHSDLKMKSVWPSGRKSRFWREAPRPRPKGPPEPRAMIAWRIW